MCQVDGSERGDGGGGSGRKSYDDGGRVLFGRGRRRRKGLELLTFFSLSLTCCFFFFCLYFQKKKKKCTTWHTLIRQCYITLKPSMLQRWDQSFNCLPYKRRLFFLEILHLSHSPHHSMNTLLQLQYQSHPNK